MTPARWTALTFLLLLAPVASAALVEVDAARWGTPEAPEEAGPGDHAVPLTVTIHNVDSEDFASARARLLATDGLGVSVPGGNVATLSGPFARGSAWLATFRVDIDDGWALGEPIRVPVEITAWRHGAEQQSTDSTTARLTGHAEIEISPEDSVLPGASRVTVPVEIQNSGDGPAGRVRVLLAPPAGGGLVLAGGDDAWSVDPLAPGEGETIEVPLLTPSTEGPQTLIATLAYSNAAGAEVTENRQLAFLVTPPAPGPLRLALDTDEVAAGRNATLRFTVANAGERPIGNLALDLVADAPGGLAPVGGGRLDAPASLAPGESANASVEAVAPLAAEDFARVQVQGTYTTDGFERRETFTFSPEVREDVTLRLLRLDASDEAYSGILVNVGTATAWNPRVSAGDGAPTLVEDLEPNEPVSFTVHAPAAKPGPVEVAVEWNDLKGRTRQESVRADAAALPEAGSRGIPAPMWAIAALAAVAVALRKGRA